MKRIIFDLDDTLIMWEEKYWSIIDETFEELDLNYEKDTLEKFKMSLSKYEEIYDRYDINSMKELIEQFLDLNLPNNFTEIWFKKLANCVPKDISKEIKNTLKYLNNKYELVVLTNFFTKPQVDRLENAKILNYFSSVIGADLEDILIKPNKESYLKACYPLNPEECLMVGDSLEKDVIGPMNIGMQAILFDKDNKYSGELKKINKIQELEYLL